MHSGPCSQIKGTLARPRAGPQLTGSLQLYSFEAAEALTLSSPEPNPQERGILRGFPSLVPICDPPTWGSPAESPPSMPEAHTPTPEAGDALIYIHLHLMYSNTEAEAEVNSADRKTPPACSLGGCDSPGRDGPRGPGWRPGPTPEWEPRGERVYRVGYLWLDPWIQPKSPAFSSLLLHNSKDAVGGMLVAHSSHQVFTGVLVPGQGNCQLPRSFRDPSARCMAPPSPQD